MVHASDLHPSLLTLIIDTLMNNKPDASERLKTIFSAWKKREPSSFAQAASDTRVSEADFLNCTPESLSELLIGDGVGQAFLDAMQDPRVQDRLETHILKYKDHLDSAHPMINSLAQDLVTADTLFSSPFMEIATDKLALLYSFIEVDSYLEGVNRITGEHIRFDDAVRVMQSRIELPFQQYNLVKEYARGSDMLILKLFHKSQEELRLGRFDGRTIGANCKLLDQPEVTERDLARMASRKRDLVYAHKESLKIQGYPGISGEQILNDLSVHHLAGLTELCRADDRPGLDDLMEKFYALDPATIVFEAGYAMKINGLYRYYPKQLLKFIAQRIEHPESEYFFMRMSGLKSSLNPRPDGVSDAQMRAGDELLCRMQIGQIVPSRNCHEVIAKESIYLDYVKPTVEVDLSEFLPVLRTEVAVRSRDIKTLANIANVHIGYADNSRHQHMVGTMYVAGLMCDSVGITGHDKKKVQVHALIHDWGHLTGSHPTELYFREFSGFDHDMFVQEIVRENKDAFEAIGISPDEICSMFSQEDPLHCIVSGPFGADRLFYLSLDPHDCGIDKEFDSLSLIPKLAWHNNELVVKDDVSAAFEFLDFRARMYQQIYFAPSTQIADAYQKKLLHATGIKRHDEVICLKNKTATNIVPKEGISMRFCDLSDILFQFYCVNHPDIEVREPARHLLSLYHKAHHPSVAVLKIRGHEVESVNEIPSYSDLTMRQDVPIVTGVDADALARYCKILSHPAQQLRLEALIAEKLQVFEFGRKIPEQRTPYRNIIVATVPNMSKLASEYAPVLVDGVVKSVFEWNPGYKADFQARADSMACLRVAVHPQFYASARMMFEKQSLLSIVREAFS